MYLGLARQPAELVLVDREATDALVQPAARDPVQAVVDVHVLRVALAVGVLAHHPHRDLQADVADQLEVALRQLLIGHLQGTGTHWTGGGGRGSEGGRLTLLLDNCSLKGCKRHFLGIYCWWAVDGCC